MQLKTITSALLLSGAAFAADIDLGNVDSIGDIGNLVPDGLSDIQNYITYAPEDVQSSLKSEPTAINGLLGDIRDGDAPEWFSQLPQSVQGAVSSAATAASGVLPTSTDSAGSDDEDDTSTNAGPRATGTVAASFAGAAGILGVAMAL